MMDRLRVLRRCRFTGNPQGAESGLADVSPCPPQRAGQKTILAAEKLAALARKAFLLFDTCQGPKPHMHVLDRDNR
jgi:hypothetical protein